MEYASGLLNDEVFATGACYIAGRGIRRKTGVADWMKVVLPGAELHPVFYKENRLLPIDPHQNVGELAVELPTATLVFIRRGIDFCCRGPRSLVIAGGAGLVKGRQIAEEIERTFYTRARLQPVDGTLKCLIEFILEKYLREAISKLSAVEFLAAKISAANCGEDPKNQRRMKHEIVDLAACIRTQFQLTEFRLFPAVLSKDVQLHREEFQRVQAAQADVVRHFQTLHEFTSGFDPSLPKCFSEKAMMTLLRDMATDFGAQLHMEHHLLYPRAR